MDTFNTIFLADGEAIFALIVVGVVALIIFAIIWSIKQEKKRREELAVIAEQMGLTFVEKGTLGSAELAQAPIFNKGRGRHVTNVMAGQVEDVELQLFDYSYTVGSGKNSTTYRHTIAALEVPNFALPKFHLKPEHWGHKFASVFGFDDIDFDDFPVFSKQYHLSGENDEAIRALFTPDVLAFFEDHVDEKWTAEAWESWIVLYRGGARLKPEQWSQFVQDAFAVVNQLTPSARQSASQPSIE